MQSLPSELKHLIAALCSPGSLAALARTHSAYQREAEEALYNNISISTFNDDSLKCMEALATFPEKAGLVRFLNIEYTRDRTRNRRMTIFLSKSLVNMHCLSDFRIRSPPDNEVAQRLGKVLWLVSYKNFDLLKKNLRFCWGNTVKIIFDYKLFTAMTFSTFLKSLSVKPNCKYLDYTVRETS